MRVSHLILDTYDLIQSPEMHDKVAALGLDYTKLAELPDRLFALVAENEGETIRKYAMHDAVNTGASIDSFLEYGGVLPKVAQDAVAENLVMACGWYDLSVPEKLAARMKDQAPGADIVAKAKAIGTHAKGYRSGDMGWPEAAQGGRTNAYIKVDVPSADYEDKNHKTADVNGTSLMPLSAQPKSTPVTKKQEIGVANTAKHSGDISGYDAPSAPVQVYEPQSYALESERRYPLDIPDHVIKAAAYFKEWSPKMEPSQRREFAVNTVKAAMDFALPVSEELSAYAGDELGEGFDAGIAQRIDRAADGFADKYAALAQRAVTGQVPSLEAVAQALEGLDKVAGLHSSYGRLGVGVDDAYKTCFGMKVAEAYSWAMEQSSVDEPGLRSLAEKGKTKLASAFGADFAESFSDDPVAIFKSMPDPQKITIANLAAAV